MLYPKRSNMLDFTNFKKAYLSIRLNAEMKLILLLSFSLCALL